MHDLILTLSLTPYRLALDGAFCQCSGGSDCTLTINWPEDLVRVSAHYICRFWTLVEEQPDLWTPVPDPLPSDARFRLDLDTLLTGDLAEAQVHTHTENHHDVGSTLQECQSARRCWPIPSGGARCVLECAHSVWSVTMSSLTQENLCVSARRVETEFFVHSSCSASASRRFL